MNDSSDNDHNGTRVTRTAVTVLSVCFGLGALAFLILYVFPKTPAVESLMPALLVLAALVVFGLLIASWTAVQLRGLRHLVERKATTVPAVREDWNPGAEVTELVSRLMDPKELFSFLLKKSMPMVRAQKGTVMLLRADGQGLDVVAAEGWQPNFVGPIDPSDTIAGSVVESGKPFIGHITSAFSSGAEAAKPSEYNSPSFLILPLRTPFRTVGTLCLSERIEGDFGIEDTERVEIFLSRAAQVLEVSMRLAASDLRVRELEDLTKQQKHQLENSRKKILLNNRLAILGDVITGVAHEVTNPVTSILGYAQMACEAENRPTEYKRLKMILHECRRVASILRNVLHFAHEQRPCRHETDLNELVRTVVALRQYELTVRNVDLSTDLDPSLPPVVLDPAGFQQVLLHLLNNAAQALPSQGARKIRIGTSYEGKTFSLWISDTGCGIPASVQENMFEPFFTSRPGAEHSGLGLPICREIVSGHGGEILVNSVPGRGTQVNIVIPAIVLPVQLPTENSGVPAKPEAQPFYSKCSALSVDDDEGNARLVAHMLEDLGFRVELATTGMEARKRILNETFDLVVCDLRMPELDGKSLYREIMRVKPRALGRVLFTSGDAEDRDVRLFTQNNGVSLLAKPFLREEFNRAVQRVFPHPEELVGSNGANRRDLNRSER